MPRPRTPFKELLNTRYEHKGGFDAFTRIINQDITVEQKIVQLSAQYGISLRQAGRWLSNVS